jgi:hypothetical protein
VSRRSLLGAIGLFFSIDRLLAIDQALATRFPAVGESCHDYRLDCREMAANKNVAAGSSRRGISSLAGTEADDISRSQLERGFVVLLSICAILQAAGFLGSGFAECAPGLDFPHHLQINFYYPLLSERPIQASSTCHDSFATDQSVPLLELLWFCCTEYRLWISI